MRRVYKKDKDMKSNSEKTVDVIVVGELNVDLILNQLESLPETGKEKLADAMTLTLGSSSAIFAGNLSSLGMKVSFIGETGDDIFGRFCKEQLEIKGVDTSMLLVNGELQTGATVVLNFGEDRAMVTHQGAMKYLGVDDITNEMLSTARHLHFSSYFLQPGFKDKLDLLFKMAKESGLTTSLDVQWDPAEQWDFGYERILPFVDIFFPNEKELLHLTKQSSIDNAIRDVSKYGNLIVVKKGKEGSLMNYNDEIISCQSFFNDDVVDAIGAGDSFNAGFIYRYIQKYNPVECQEFANLIGAISTTKAGGTTAFINYRETMKIAKEKFGYEE